ATVIATPPLHGALPISVRRHEPVVPAAGTAAAGHCRGGRLAGAESALRGCLRPAAGCHYPGQHHCPELQLPDLRGDVHGHPYPRSEEHTSELQSREKLV